MPHVTLFRCAPLPPLTRAMLPPLLLLAFATLRFAYMLPPMLYIIDCCRATALLFFTRVIDSMPYAVVDYAARNSAMLLPLADYCRCCDIFFADAATLLFFAPAPLCC